MLAATITAERHLAFPEEILEILGLRIGDRVALRVRQDGVIEMQPARVDLMSLCGSIKPEVRGVTLEDMDAAIRKAATERT